jgi:hypothetical protein
MKLISFYVDPPGTNHYTKCAERLRQACRELGYDHEIVELEDRGQWALNCNLKPAFIRERLRVHKQVLWVDIDCRLGPGLVKTVETCLGDHDVAVARIRKADGPVASPYESVVKTPCQCRDWIHAWNDKDGSRRLLNLWTIGVQEHPSMFDHTHLQYNLNKLAHKGMLDWVELPWKVSGRGGPMFRGGVSSKAGIPGRGSAIIQYRRERGGRLRA